MKSRKMLSLYLFLLGITVITMCLLWSVNNRKPSVRDYHEIAQEGVLRLITEYEQSGYYISGDTVKGFQYELAQAIADLSGLEVQIQLEMNLPKSFQELGSGNCDIIARNIPITSEMKETFLFTDPIILNKQVLVQRAASINDSIQPIRNHLELAGKTLYIPKDSPALLRLRNLEDEIGDSIHIIEDKLYSSEQLIIMVAKGDIDYAVCEQLIAAKAQERYPEIDIATDISFTQLQSWVLRKESVVLLDSLNYWFNQIRENGLYDKIYNRYYK
ncbi:transporter substrate-binding domain-containing protein [Parabacteroides sp. OttesenSCG-928-G21]|nr:transporter substrate-binding domain-containing protein [Parabacteroides sp. OttesenSCG-928-G21]